MLSIVLATALAVPSAQDIITRVVTIAQNNDRLVAERLVFDRTEVIQDMGQTPPQIKNTKIWHITGTNGKNWQQLISEDGQPITNGKQEPAPLSALGPIVSRYRFALASAVVQPCDGHECYAIAFEPIAEEAPADSNEEALLNHTHGILLVDTEHWFVRQLTGELVKPFRRKGVAMVHRASLRIHQEEVGGLVLTDSVSATVSYTTFSVLFVKVGAVNEHYEHTYQYAPLAATVP